MGRSKAMLPIGSEVMLQRVCRTLVSIVRPLCVVAAAEQELPDLSDHWLQASGGPVADGTSSAPDRPLIQTARDPVEYRGPLAGLAVGLRELQHHVDAVYVSACDAPLLRPEFVQAMITALGDAEIAVPWDGEFYHPLAAVYRVSVLPRIEELLAGDRLRPVFLFEKCQTRRVDVQELRAADPDLDSLCNTNTPEEYERALARIASEGIP